MGTWRVFALLCLCFGPAFTSLAQRQPAVTISLSASTVPARSVVGVTISVTDQDGPVTAGQVDLLDGGKPVGTAQLVSSSTAGLQPGTAILRKIFSSGAHSLQGSFRQTTIDGAATSSTVDLQVTGTQAAPSAAPFYTATSNLTYGTELNSLVSVKVADVNNDGVPDLIATESTPARIAISLGDPAHPGQFLAPTFIDVTGQGSGLGELAAVDYDADGFVDLAVSAFTTSGYSVLLYHNDPREPGSFTLQSQINSATLSTVIDLNHDGLPDILGGYGNSCVLFFNDPAHPGQFIQPGTQIPISEGTSCRAADINGDGIPDLFYQGNQTMGSGQVVNIAAVLPADPLNPGKYLPEVDYPLPVGFNLGTITDVNEDGTQDILAVAAGFLAVLPGNKGQPGTFGSALFYPTPSTSPVSIPGPIAVGDINGDGYTDVVAGSEGNNLMIFYGQADGTLQPGVALMTGATDSPAWQEADVEIADLDGDGLSDIVSASGYQTALQIFSHQSAGTALIRTATDLSDSPEMVIQGSTLNLIAHVSATDGTPSGTVEFYGNPPASQGPPYVSLGTRPLVNGIATLQVPDYMQDDVFFAAFHGDPIYAPSASYDLGVEAYAGPLTAVVLQVSPGQVFAGQPVTLTGTVIAPGTPTGSVQFLQTASDSQPYGPTLLLATSPVDATGHATFTTTSLARGSHTFSAAYVVNGTVVATSSPYTLAGGVNVLAPPSTLSLTMAISPSQPLAFDPTQLIATVQPSSASQPIPTGAVQFWIQNSADTTASYAALGTASLNSQGVASLTVAGLAAGEYTISFTYGGDVNYGTTGSGSTQLSVAPSSALSNMLIDPGFESESSQTLSTAWSTTGASNHGVDVQLGNAHSGSNNGFVWDDTNTWNDIGQTVAVKPNTEYVFSGWIRSYLLGNVGYFSVVGSTGIINESSFGNLPQYSFLVVRFNSGANTSVRVRAGFWGQNAVQWMQVDDLALRPNLLDDPGFEQYSTSGPTEPLPAPWFGMGTSNKGIDVGLGNARSGGLNGFVWDNSIGWNGIAQTIPVQPNTSYLFTGWVQSWLVGPVGYFSVDGLGGIVNETPFAFLPGYELLAVPFNSGANTSVTVWAGFWGQNTIQWIRVDDVALQQVD